MGEMAMTLETHFRSTTTGTGASQLQVFVSQAEHAILATWRENWTTPRPSP